jgi:DNA polymerase III epsilon subunit-like protein
MTSHGVPTELHTDETDWVFIGLDGEMSSADITTGGALIQAGAASLDPATNTVEVFSSLIRPPSRYEWSERAAAVHGISEEQLKAAPSAEQVDEELHEWLLAHGAVAERRVVVPVGLNVASFDLPFFKTALPRATALLARRSVDLNAVLFTLEHWDPNPKSAPRDFAAWKRSMKTHANRVILERGLGAREHDAGFDAAQALIGWHWLRSQIHAPVARAAALDERLNETDPLRAALGDGLLHRLVGIDRAFVQKVVEALNPAVSPRRWFGTKHPALNTTPLDALTAGRHHEVLAAAIASGASAPSSRTP